MKLYHGSNMRIDTIDLSKSKPHKDFGQGFYLSDNEEQAWAMASQKVIQTEVGTETFNVYEFDEKNLTAGRLHVLRFDEYTKEWAEFVVANRNRTNRKFVHDYDIVIGPIADDKVGVQIRLYNENYIDMSILLKRLKYIKGITLKYFFGTQRAIQTLKRI